MQSAVKDLKQETTRLGNSVTRVEAENTLLRAQVEDQAERLEDLEIYSRAHDIIVRGLPETSHAERATKSATDSSHSSLESHQSVESSILSLCNDSLLVPTMQRDILVAHRLKAGKNDKYRPVIVRFASRKIRDEVFRAKKKLSLPRVDGVNQVSPSERVYITEHLTRKNSDIFFEARKLVKSKQIASAWSYNGLTNVKLTSEAQERPIVIRSVADLQCSLSSLFGEARKLIREKKLASAWPHKGLVNVKFSTNVLEKPTVVHCVDELHSYVINIDFSDHRLVKFTIDLASQPANTVTFTARDLKKLDSYQFSELLRKSPIIVSPPASADDYVAQMDSDVITILDRLAPMRTRTKRLGARRKAEWLTPAANDAKCLSRQLERHYRASRKEEDYVKWRKAARVSVKMMNSVRSRYYGDSIRTASAEPQTMWKTVRKLLHLKPEVRTVSDKNLAV